jgi:hypothetical protein
MSDHYITLIPATPNFVPPAQALTKARNLLAKLVPKAEKVEACVTKDIQFVDQGQNFERVCCPNCSSKLGIGWWKEAMDKSYKSRFRELKVTTPCCAFSTSLNDLNYRAPAGFARCSLRVMNPQLREISHEQLHKLERLMGTALRQIWSHY